MERGRGVQRCGAPRVLAPEGGPHLCAPKVEVHPPHPPTPLPKLSQRLGLGREVGGWGWGAPLVCACVCMHVYVCACLARGQICAYMHVHTQASVHASACAYMCACTHVGACTCVDTCMHVHCRSIIVLWAVHEGKWGIIDLMMLELLTLWVNNSNIIWSMIHHYPDIWMLIEMMEHLWC